MIFVHERFGGEITLQLVLRKVKQSIAKTEAEFAPTSVESLLLTEAEYGFHSQVASQLEQVLQHTARETKRGGEALKFMGSRLGARLPELTRNTARVQKRF